MDLRKEFHSESNAFRHGDELALIFSVKLMRKSLVSRNESWGSENESSMENLEGLEQLWWPHTKESAR